MPPRVLLLGPTQSGKREQCTLLSKAYPRVPIIDAAEFRPEGTVHKQDLVKSGCFCYDRKATADHLSVVGKDFFDTIVLLRVPDEILVQRWHEGMKKLDANHDIMDESMNEAVMAKAGAFHLNLRGHLDSYDHGDAVFVDVNGHGSQEDVLAFIKAFVDAGEAQQSENFDLSYKLYGEAAQLAAHLGQSDGVASACCGQGASLLSAHKLKKALVMLDHALELNPNSLCIQQWHKKSKTAIREMLEEKKRAKHSAEERAKHEEAQRILIEKEKEKQEWLHPLREEIKLRKQQQFKVAKVHADALKLTNNFTHYSILDRQRLRKQFNAYSTDMTRGQVLKMMVKKVAPAVVLRATETAMAQRLMAHQAEILKKKKEKEELENYLRKKNRDTMKSKRFSVYQNERMRKLNEVIETAENTIDACRQGVPLDLLKTLVDGEVSAMKAVMGRDSNQVTSERHIDKVSQNDVFDILTARTNAMVVESMHPYSKGSCHIVELTPTNDVGGGDLAVSPSGKHGLAICFHNYCDIKSGFAEIRFFTDKSCQYQVGDEVYHNDNLPTMGNPLFINTKSVVMMFKSRNWDDSHIYYSSWGWKMCIVKAKSKAQFEEITMRGAVDAAISKRVICGTTKAASNCFISACYGGNVEALEYLLKLGEEFCFDINEREMLTGDTLLHVAASCGREEVAQFLVNNGALRDVQNFQLETPLHVATRCGHTHIVRLLIFEDEVVATHLDKERRRVFSPELHRKRAQKSKKKLRETKKREKYVDTLRKAMLSAKNHKGRTPRQIACIGDEWAGGELDAPLNPAVPTMTPKQRPKSANMVHNVKKDNLLIMLNEERTEFTPKKGFFMGRPVTAPSFLLRKKALKDRKSTAARSTARARPSTANRVVRRTLREKDDGESKGRGNIRPTLIAWHKDEKDTKKSNRPKTAGARMSAKVK
ncbi:hypothetical protein TrST_g2728 [Triparma strigata]|uniref:Uncharacterized protein n=1 Tax=Triparma strigata TaxID=1606541 RepID=A0A9W7AXR0_9STRA|nr:hypothetical protein TrST_g2728 [Triparma strigata]